MPKYLVQAQYTTEGLKGTVGAGFGERERYLRQLTEEELGGTLEALYWAWGSDDLIAVMDIPDETMAIAGVLATALSGVSHQRTTPLLTAEQMDAARAKIPSFTGPGD